MPQHKEESIRTAQFKRNNSLEGFLNEINNDLWHSEKKLLENKEPEFPLIFIVGAHRSGSTLLMQWLANLGSIAYPTNLMSRFYTAPIMASKIQLLLTDERYNFRNEIIDFNSSIDFSSKNGKTQGALAPNEFWYFWRKFLPFKELDFLPTEELYKKVDIDTIKAELSGITKVFQKPFALKAMILNYNIEFLDSLFKRAIFIHVKRDPLTNIASALQARERQMGSIDEWYSFKFPEYFQLKELSPYEQVAGQIFYINKAVEEGLETVAEHKKLTINYEEFCHNPEGFFDELVEKLGKNNCVLDGDYIGPKMFSVTRNAVTDEQIIKAYQNLKPD